MGDEESRETAAPYSLRLSKKERAALERAATGMSLAAYMRARLFEDGLPEPRRVRCKYPVKDYKAIAALLSKLGDAHLANNMNQLARAANSGSLPVTPDTVEALEEACAQIAAMRADLIRALGLMEGRS